MSNMTDEQVRRSLRRSGRNTALFGLAFVLLSSLLFIAEWDQLGEPLGRKLFSLPRSVLFGLLLVCGLSLVGWGVRTVLSLRRR